MLPLMLLSECSARLICWAAFILSRNSRKLKLGDVIGNELVPPLNIPCIASIPRFPVCLRLYSERSQLGKQRNKHNR